MSNLVVFDIGHGSDTYPPSKGIGGFAEHDFNSKVVLQAKKLAELQGFKVILSQGAFEKDVLLRRRVENINSIHKKTPILCIISFHANASNDTKAGGKGVFYSQGSTKGKRLAELWLKRSSILDVKNWGPGLWVCEKGTWKDFYIVQKTVPPCILVEHFFFTNPQELAKCNTLDFINKSALVAVQALCDFAGKTYHEERSADLQGNKFFRVQVGAYSDMNNAVKMADSLKNKGFPCYIVES